MPNTSTKNTRKSHPLWIHAATTTSFLAISILLLSIRSSYTNSEAIIKILSTLGWLELIFCLLTMKKRTGKLFSIYSIFIIFAFLFNYGQCLFWALGFHLDNEIGKQSLYTLQGATTETIINAQLFTLASLLSFHMGALVACNKTPQNDTYDKNTDKKRTILLKASWACNIISSPLMLYAIIRSIIINRTYGYGATLYNNDVIATQNNLIMLLRMMYLPSLFGILISSKYGKTQKAYCYISFTIYTVLSMIAGDRGEWLFPLLFLVWMHHSYFKPIKIKRAILYFLAALAIIIASVGIRNSRNTGVTIDGFKTAIAEEDSPIISAAFEMGGSMRPTLVLMQYGWKEYPYGNSYLLALVGMITEKPILMIIPQYKSLSSWFSSEYLGINYGAGFSFIAEALANFGPYLSVLALFIIGILFSKSIFSSENINYEKNPLVAFVTVSTANAAILSIRNTMLVSMKYFVYSTLIILFVYYILYVHSLNFKKKEENALKKSNA